MGVKLEAKTGKDDKLRIIATVDDAIDWDATYPEMGPASERKMVRYIESGNDAEELVLKPDAKPTLFVFSHPKRVDISKKVRGIFTKQASEKEKADMFSDIYDQAFLGTQEGSDDAEVDLAPRLNGKMQTQYLQALTDAGVFEELGLAFINAANKRPTTDLLKKK